MPILNGESVMMEFSLLSDLSKLESKHGGRLRIRQGLTGREVTTFALGGELPLLAEPHDLESLSDLVHYLSTQSLPWRVLGAGSNVVIADTGINEVVLRLGAGFQGGMWLESELSALVLPPSLSVFPDFEQLPRPKRRRTLLVYGAASLMSLSRRASSAGLSGLEFAAGIPASVGGAAVMNAGAHGRSFSDSCRAVVTVTGSGSIEVLDSAGIGFGYRETNIPLNSVVIGAVLELYEGDQENIRLERTRCLDYRKRTQPLHLPSAGSVFANPTPERAAAAIIEECGFKGYRRGGVMVSEMHANWIVRVSEEGRASEVRGIVDEIRDDVYRRRDIVLRPEICFWGRS